MWYQHKTNIPHIYDVQNKSTNGLLNARKPNNSLIHQLTNRRTHKLTKRKTQKIINSETHKHRNSSTHKLDNSQTYNLKNPLLNSSIRPYCQLFSTSFNIMNTLSIHQSPTLPQKIDSREGLFWCKKGLAVHAGKMNFYLNWPPLTPTLGPFAAKRSAFWC